jgi:outer membrane protein assembly factor BamB
VALVTLAAAAAPAQEWTRFRGPNGAGLSEADGIPVTWSEKEEVWRARLPGTGISQPVLWGGRIFLTAANGDGSERSVVCLEAADGSVAWRTGWAFATSPKHQRSSHAASTPAVDAERVYYTFSTPEKYVIGALDHAGKEVWTVDLGSYVNGHGDGASPIVFEETVILANEQDGQSFIIALDRKSGATRWKTPRRSSKAAYATPFVLDRGPERPQLILASQAHGIAGLDARSGEALWEAPVFDKRVVASPILAGGWIISTCGSGGGGNYAAAVKPGGKGADGGSEMAYKLDKSMSYVPTPIARGELVFFWSDLGVATCAEAATGKIVWQKRVQGAYSGSPVCVRDRIYCMTDDGEAVVIAASRDFQVLARNPLGEGSRSTPAVAGNRMYLRTFTHLIAVGGKKPQP